MKTVEEAILATQKRKAGFVNRQSVKYAETLLLPGEEVKAAAVANIASKRGNFPGVVVITDQRIFAACGLPGIKRQISLNIPELRNCEETASVLKYEVVVHTKETAFSFSVDPDVGDFIAPFVAELNGEEFEAVTLKVDGKILNPNMVARRQRAKKSKERTKRLAEEAKAEAKENFKDNEKLKEQAASMFEDNETLKETVKAKHDSDIALAKAAAAAFDDNEE